VWAVTPEDQRMGCLDDGCAQSDLPDSETQGRWVATARERHEVKDLVQAWGTPARSAAREEF